VAEQIVDVRELSDSSFVDLYENILSPSFPPNELLTLDEFRYADVGEARTPAFAVVDDGLPVAAAFGDYDPDCGIVLLAYLATRADRRSRGVGRRLLVHAQQRWEQQLSPAAFLAEIEDPASHGPSPYGDPVARVRFYQSFGAGRLALPYVQPSLRPGAERVRGMMLISFALAGRGHQVPAPAVADYLHRYLAGCEGILDASSDPDFGPIFARLEAFGDGDVPVEPLVVHAASHPDP
jgi:GNAT superfamily N-acetyltransferase